jgi:hypothetical protein
MGFDKELSAFEPYFFVRLAALAHTFRHSKRRAALHLSHGFCLKSDPRAPIEAIHRRRQDSSCRPTAPRAPTTTTGWCRSGLAAVPRVETSGVGRHTPSATRPAGSDLAKYEGGGEYDDNYRHRMMVNIAALSFTAVLAIAAVGW